MAEKTPHNDLIEEISATFHTYLKKGVRIGSVIGKSIEDLPIQNIEELIQIYFILTDNEVLQSMPEITPSIGVVEYIEKLPNRLQSLPTSTATTRTTTIGHIEGRIDWQGTIEARSQTNPSDVRRFKCATPEETHSDPNNRVLKELLNKIRDALDTLEFALDGDGGFAWLGPWHEANAGQARIFREDILQNVHIERITVDESVSDRTIRSVKQSRHELYREAAELLQYYRQLMRYEGRQADAKQLLRSFFITPENTKRGKETLFELYWIFKLLQTFERPKFKLVTPGTNEVAKWSTPTHQYRMYHDCSGSDKLTYRITNDDLRKDSEQQSQLTNFSQQRIEVLDKKRDISEQWLGKKTRKDQWVGRPDIILEQYNDNGELQGVFVGDAKYSHDPSYLSSGIEEVLEYTHLVQSDGDYLKTKVGDRVEWISGGLFTDASQLDAVVNDEITVLHTDVNPSDFPLPWTEV